MNSWKVVAIIAIVALVGTLVYFLGFDSAGTSLFMSGTTKKVDSNNCLSLDVSPEKLTASETKELIANKPQNVIISQANKDQLSQVIDSIIAENPEIGSDSVSNFLFLEVLFNVCCTFEEPCCDMFPQ